MQAPSSIHPGGCRHGEGLAEWLLSTGLSNERADIRLWSWLLMSSAWRASHCKYFMLGVKEFVEVALKGDKCPRGRSAVACAIGTYAIGLDVSDEGYEFVETLVEYLESGLVVECSKEVRREILIALQHCYNSLSEEGKDLERLFRKLSITRGGFSDPFPPNNQLVSSTEPVYSTLCHDEIDRLLELQKGDSKEFMRRPPPSSLLPNCMPPGINNEAIVRDCHTILGSHSRNLMKRIGLTMVTGMIMKKRGTSLLGKGQR